MAKLEKGLGPVKRYGVRYGRTTKFKAAQIERQQRKKQKCPYCLKSAAKRVAEGIFECDKCESKFTGGAYVVTPQKIQETTVEEPKAPITQEEEEDFEDLEEIEEPAE